MNMNAAGALQAYANQSALIPSDGASRVRSRALAASQARITDPKLPPQPVTASAKQLPLTSGLDLLA